MGFLQQLFNKVSERDELVMQAGRVGDANEVIRMGIIAAQLGLTPDDIGKMARVYLLLRDTSTVVPDSDFVIERFLRAVRMTHDD